MMILGLINLLLALGCLWFWLQKMPLTRVEKILASFLLLWGSMVMAGHTLSAFDALRAPVFYVVASLAWVNLFGWALAAACPTGNIQPIAHISQPQLFSPIQSRRDFLALQWTCWLLLGAALVTCCILMLLVEPTNADSISYRLPRVFWYVSHGNLLHPFYAFDNRVVYYPLNGVLLYLPNVLFELPGRSYTFPSILSWGMVVVACFAFGRLLGAPRIYALLLATLVGLTPPILAQSLSTNDEIFSSSALLVGLYFFCRFFSADWRGFFWLAALGVGLSIGTKLHIFFYAPVLIIALLMLLWQGKKNPIQAQAIVQKLGWSGWGGALAIGAAMVLPFMLYNVLSTGRLYHTDDFAKDFFNLTGNWQVFFQNVLIYLNQLVLAPIVDLYGSIADDKRLAFSQAFNQQFGEWIRPLLSDNPSFYHFNYRYMGLVLGVSIYFVEYSLWPGFVYLLWAATLAIIIRSKKIELKRWWLLLALAPVIWFFYWCYTTLYMEGTATYLTYYIVVASPALLFGLIKLESVFWSRLRWAIVTIVMATNTIIGINYFNLNVFRGFQIVQQSPTLPANWEYYSPAVVNEIKGASEIRIVFQRWGFSYFSMMRENPRANYLSPTEEYGPTPTRLVIYPTLATHKWGFAAVRIPNKRTPGLTLVGTMQGWGTEAVFMAGNGVEQRHPGRNNFILLRLNVDEVPKNGKFKMESRVPGLLPEDGLEFQYELWRNDKLLQKRPWSREPGWVSEAPPTLLQEPHRMKIFVRDAFTKQVVADFESLPGADLAWVEDSSAPKRIVQPYQLF